MRTRLLRLFGLTLLLLAVSPATEPFATVDLADLFGTPGTPATSSLQQQKASADDPEAAPGSTSASRPLDSTRAERLALRHDTSLEAPGTHRPLRI